MSSPFCLVANRDLIIFLPKGDCFVTVRNGDRQIVISFAFECAHVSKYLEPGCGLRAAATAG